jgi:RHS repeat-associated protein
VVWRWENTEPFGKSPPEEDPDGDGQGFAFNLRFPGQYFDPETGLSYNMARDYDPQTGRYVQSDPIGLAGGINPYLYAFDPLAQIDPLGLMGRSAGAGKSAPGPVRFGGGAAGLNQAPVVMPYCDGRWMRVGNFRRSAVPGLYMIFGQVPPCWCDWNCRSCPGGADITANPPIATNTTKGFLFFSGTAGSQTDPERGDTCLCSRPGPEKGCSGC